MTDNIPRACRHCDVPMVRGKAMVPVWGRLDGRPIGRYDRSGPRTSALRPVWKCPSCGHSVSEEGRLYGHCVWKPCGKSARVLRRTWTLTPD